MAPLWEQAQVLADRLTGRNLGALYGGSRVSTKLKVMGVDLSVMGDKEPSPGDEVVQYSEPARGIYKRMLIRDGQLAGAILLGDPDGPLDCFRPSTGGFPLPDNRSEVLFPGARLDGAFSAATLADDAQICNCNGVTKARLTAAIADGCRSLRALCDATRAGTGCGSCKPQVQQVLEAVRRQSRGRRSGQSTFTCRACR